MFYAIHAKNNKENEDIIRIILSDGRADIDWQDQRKQTPLIHAIRRKLSSTVSLLLDYKPCLDKRNDKQRFAIWYAIENCDEDLVRVLLQSGCDIRTRDHKGVSLAILAIERRYVAIARILLQHPDRKTGKSLLEDVNARDRLLRRVVKSELQDIILLLVAHGANPIIRNEYHETLLHQAAEKGDRNMIQQLLVYEQTSVDARDNHGRTSLHIAAEYGHKSITGHHCLAGDQADRCAVQAPSHVDFLPPDELSFDFATRYLSLTDDKKIRLSVVDILMVRSMFYHPCWMLYSRSGDIYLC